MVISGLANFTKLWGTDPSQNFNVASLSKVVSQRAENDTTPPESDTPK